MKNNKCQKIKIKNNRQVLISNGTYLDYADDVINELIIDLLEEGTTKMIATLIVTEIIASMYEKMFGTCTDDDIEIIEE